MRVVVVAVALLLSLPEATGDGCRSAIRYDERNNPYEVQICDGSGETTTPGISLKPKRRWAPHELIRVVSQVDGQPCSVWVTRRSQRGLDGVVAEHDQQVIGTIFDTAVTDVWDDMVSALPRCAGVARPAEQAAFAFIYEYVTPSPDPYIAPGFAITGKRAYVETRGPLQHEPAARETELGLLTVRFEAVGFTVDWGDGTPATEHESPGLAWPQGTAVHTFQHMGAYDITVAQRWRAVWQLGSESGELILTGEPVTIDDFEVRQVQAVITG